MIWWCNVQCTSSAFFDTKGFNQDFTKKKSSFLQIFSICGTGLGERGRSQSCVRLGAGPRGDRREEKKKGGGQMETEWVKRVTNERWVV